MIDKRKLKVLICDPDLEKRGDLERILNEVGVKRVTKVNVFLEILDTIKESKPNLIIISDTYPDVKATEVLTYLKIEPAIKDVPVLLYGGGDNHALIRELVSMGLTGVISSPPDVPGVRHAMRNYFRRVTTQEITKLVKECPFFDELSQQELVAVAKYAIPRHYQTGEEIFQKGSPGDSFYIVLKGRIETMVTDASGRPITFSNGVGQPVGEMAILDKAPRSAFCIAADDTIMLELGPQIIFDTADNLRVKVFAKLAIILAERLRGMNQLLEVGQKLPSREPVETTLPEESTPNLERSPLATPTGKCDLVDDSISGQEEYDVLQRKIHLRMDFIGAKIPETTCEMVWNKLHGYWTGGKLAKINTHRLWSAKAFTPGTARLQDALHLVVAHAGGEAGYLEAFLGLPLSHGVVGKSDTGCVGTFLESGDALRRYLEGECLKTALEMDLKMSIEREWAGHECIEYLTHTRSDVREQTAFLVFDTVDGDLTRAIREEFPDHQILTVVKGFGFDPGIPGSLFTGPEHQLKLKGHLSEDKSATGFYAGETFFLPDFSQYYLKTDKLKSAGSLFGTIGMIAQLGPDYSGVSWGSKGGADGAVRSARAMYGVKGAQNPEELADAINWADR